MVSIIEDELVERMRSGSVPFIFKKVDGSYRWAIGTLDPRHFPQKTAGAFSDLMNQVEQVIKRKKLHLDRMADMNSKLQLVEGQADKLMLDLLRDLYSGRHDPIRAMMLRDLYDLMEKVVDRCRDAGNVVSHIVLKYS